MAVQLRPAGAGRDLSRRGPWRGPAFEVRVLGDFEVRRGGVALLLPESTRRLVALLALLAHPVRRKRAAGILWPDKDDDRANANLRSCLWRLGQVAPGLVHAAGDPLELVAGVRVDLVELSALANRLDSDVPVDTHIDATVCCGDLLPDFDDEFIEEHREFVRQLRLRTLEGLSRRLLLAGDFGAALKLALLAVSQAPMRESAHQLVLECHLAEGNASEALRHYGALKNTLWHELGIRPTERMRTTMAPLHRRDDPSERATELRPRGTA